MDKTKKLLNETFESSSSRTQQYLNFHRTFKREFTQLMKPICSEIDIHKPNHFDVSGFFKTNSGKTYYISLGDLRWDKHSLLYRTAKDFKDYSGGINEYISMDNIENLFSIISNRESRGD